MAVNLYASFPTKSNVPTAAYPYGSARDVTVSGDGTGTPRVAALVNDYMGFLQKLLSEASITPSGDPDSVLASDYYEALRKTCGYPGFVQLSALTVDPATLGIKALVMNGSGVLASNYPELVAATYCGDVHNGTAYGFYRANDAAGVTRNTAGVYFILPDARGLFIRMLDVTEENDPDGAGRILGSFQDHNLLYHTHEYDQLNYAELLSKDGGSAGAYALVADATLTETGSTNNMRDLSNQPFPAGTADPDEVRPKNIALNYLVWY